uniref:Uncharacterized protein n=1 Tax=Meloidogyne enterolobii TaxID=390850 RepID=A0A6V7VHY1_MELEN|nr:unnamed protein product [Meloidogyne enterolobii]
MHLSPKANALILHGILSFIGVVGFSYIAIISLVELTCRFPEIDDFQNFFRRRQNSPTIPQHHEHELTQQHFHPEPSYRHRYQESPEYYHRNAYPTYHPYSERPYMASDHRRQSSSSISQEMQQQDFQPQPNSPHQNDEENPQHSSVPVLTSDGSIPYYRYNIDRNEETDQYTTTDDQTFQPRPRRSPRQGNFCQNKSNGGTCKDTISFHKDDKKSNFEDFKGQGCLNNILNNVTGSQNNIRKKRYVEWDCGAWIVLIIILSLIAVYVTGFYLIAAHVH